MEISLATEIILHQTFWQLTVSGMTNIQGVSGLFNISV